VRDSFIVLLVLPVAMAGGVAGLRFLGLFHFQALDLLTMIGFIILLGLVVNASILLWTRPVRASVPACCAARRWRRHWKPAPGPSCCPPHRRARHAAADAGARPGAEIYRGLATVTVGGMVLGTPSPGS